MTHDSGTAGSLQGRGTSEPHGCPRVWCVEGLRSSISARNWGAVAGRTPSDLRRCATPSTDQLASWLVSMSSTSQSSPDFSIVMTTWSR
jgi:hypothetical protein